MPQTLPGMTEPPLAARTSEEKLRALGELLQLEACQFAELLGTLHTMRFTGRVELHFLNGQPQTANLGAPLVAKFSDHPANRA